VLVKMREQETNCRRFDKLGNRGTHRCRVDAKARRLRDRTAVSQIRKTQTLETRFLLLRRGHPVRLRPRHAISQFDPKSDPTGTPGDRIA
jgi:hypothetical protein